MEMKAVDQALLDAVVEILEEDAWNYSVFLKSVLIENYKNRDSVETMRKVFGEDVVAHDIHVIRKGEVWPIISTSLYYAGDEGAGPAAQSLSSRKFQSLISKLRGQVENILRATIKVESFWFREGHPAYPVFWDFAFVFTGETSVTILVGSSSD